MNKVILQGRLVRDPEIAWTRSEDSKKYAKYTLAVNRRFKQKGKNESDADFIPCIAWGAMEEFAEKFMRKGVMFSVVGRLNIQDWTDNEGKKHRNTTVIVDESYFCERKAVNAAESGAQQNNPSDNGFYPIEEGVEDDDLPF